MCVHIRTKRTIVVYFISFVLHPSGSLRSSLIKEWYECCVVSEYQYGQRVCTQRIQWIGKIFPIFNWYSQIRNVFFVLNNIE